MKPEIREVAYGTPEHASMLELRRQVLRAPLGMDFTDEDREQEPKLKHVGAFVSGRAVATVVILPLKDGKVKFRQMAVAPEWRGEGVGLEALRFAERLAKEQGFTEVTLNARGTAEGFYAKAGYRMVGKWFEEHTLPHIEMRKVL